MALRLVSDDPQYVTRWLWTELLSRLVGRTAQASKVYFTNTEWVLRNGDDWLPGVKLGFTLVAALVEDEYSV